MILDDETKRRAPTIGLELTKNKTVEINSGYIHFENNSINNINEETNIKSETFDKIFHIKDINYNKKL